MVVHVCWCFFFFFFKQKTAYEMRISDWSSDVCSSDLDHLVLSFNPWKKKRSGCHLRVSSKVSEGWLQLHQDLLLVIDQFFLLLYPTDSLLNKIGRASCRERVCQYV